MDHLAILNPKYHYLPRILDGTKSIESRWYKSRTAPWNKIKAGDTIYFKDSGKPVTLQATVSKVLQFDHSPLVEFMAIIRQYGRQITANNLNIGQFYESVKDKNYVILVFLTRPKAFSPFSVNKSGFGSAAAWLCVDSINKIRKN